MAIIKIEDWYDIHNGYELTLKPGYTALVGPNGAGKTTLLYQIEEYAKVNGYECFHYDNLVDGGANAQQKYFLDGKTKLGATTMLSSEGECLAINFRERVAEIGQMVRKAVAAKKPLYILLDSLDSGASVDRIRELRGLFDLIAKDSVLAEVYIISSGNAYEMAKNADCVNVRTGEHITFSHYETYANFICNYFDMCKSGDWSQYSIVEDYTQLREGSNVWYVDFEDGSLEKGTITHIEFKGGVVESLCIEFPESNDMDEFYPSALGKYIFISEAAAQAALVRGEGKAEND